MRPSRGMGAINPSKMPTAKVKARRDDTDFKQFNEGGSVEKNFAPVESDYSMRLVGGGGKDEGGVSVGGRASLVKKLDKDTDLEGYLEGYASKAKGMGAKGEITGGGVRFTKRFAKGGLYENIHAKQARIKAGSGEKMRKPGSKGAPTDDAFKKAERSRKK